MPELKALMIGDVVGDPGIAALEKGLSVIRNDKNVDFVVVNGENAAGGFGIDPPSLERILAAGADLVSSGNHVWEKRDIWPVLEQGTRLIRPANYPDSAPGRGWFRQDKEHCSWTVINLQGRERMTPIDCPFRTADSILSVLDAPQDTGPNIILVDFHAESMQEKEALALYLDGRVHAVAGTHTHVQTADQRLLPKGSAYISDLGMTGVRDSIIGMENTICLERNRTQIPLKMELAAGPAEIQGILLTFNAEDGKALSVERLKIPV